MPIFPLSEFPQRGAWSQATDARKSVIDYQYWVKEEIKGACVLRVNGNAYQFCRLFY